jgi:hypothetical protein
MWSSILHSIFHGAIRERDLVLLLGAFGVGGFSAWLGARFGAKRAIKRAFRDNIEIPSVVTDVRYDELSRAIDAIALEVERIAEAQRFSAKILAEQQTATQAAPVAAPHTAPLSASRREPGVTTPH